jgi:DNA-binding beta-propeller fold protein YncE
MRSISLSLALLALSASLASAATISTVAGTGTRGFAGDGGPATAAQLDNPFGVVRGPDGALWFCEYGGQRVRRIATDGTISTVVGTGAKGHTGDGGPSLAATLNLPHEIRFDRAGNLFIVDMMNHAVRRVDAKTRIITTVVGTGQPGYAGDGGPAAKAQLNQPHSIQFNPHGDLFICDIRNNVIRRVDMTTGLIATFAGTGKPGETPDGAPIAGTPLRGPRSLDFDRDGNLWLATREGNQILRFDLNAGKIIHVAGTGAKGFTGDGGLAALATFNGPKGIALHPVNGNAYIVDTENHAIRMIDRSSGRIELVAGTGIKGDGPEGNPTACALARPHGIFIEADGQVFIGDSETHRVRVVR